MPTHLYIAPAASGKTRFVLQRARAAAQNLAPPRVCVATNLQARALKRQLAEMGGALGVRVLAFDQLYAECLRATREVYTELSEPVLYRLTRAIVDAQPLTHYASLKDRPGFIQILQDLFGELKAERVFPDDLLRAINALGGAPRLTELVAIYATYQKRLRERNWADRAGLGWIAVEALEDRAPHVARDWALLIVDGFDNFTQVQIALLQLLAPRVQELIITLTGARDGTRDLVHQRFDRTRERLERALAITAEPLPAREAHHAPALAHLEADLYTARATRVPGAPHIELIHAPNRVGEVRAALRWLKARLVHDAMRPDEVALAARNLENYRPFISQIAREFDLPIRLVAGVPLRTNPAVVALLDLVQLLIQSPAFPRRLVIEAWRSPYLDWKTRIDLADGDAEQLDLAARWGRVIGGLDQWRDALAHLAQHSPAIARDDEPEIPAHVPAGEIARALLTKFDQFVALLTPPASARSYRDFVAWSETLIENLDVLARADGEIDRAALDALKDVLRGLVWAEEAIPSHEAIALNGFVKELIGAVDAATFRLPLDPGRAEIIVTDVIHARGLAFRAVAILGLAEGEFPTTLTEDPFLRDADRARLRDEFEFAINLSTASAETEFFYEAITRAREKLLLTRPRLADNGAEWQASPFWEEVVRRVIVEPHPPAADAASWNEVFEAFAVTRDAAWRAWIQQTAAARLDAFDARTRLLDARTSPDASPFDGDLSGDAGIFAQRFGPAYVWSASQIESYRTCAWLYFTARVLKLEPRTVPAEGLDAAQLGNVYHHLFKAVYDAARDKTDRDQLVAALDQVAPIILDAAPAREGFRETAWWTQTRAEIIANVRAALIALNEYAAEFTPTLFERGFGGATALVVREGADEFRLRGFIDRIDRARDGRLLIIDYKTGGPSAYTIEAFVRGKRVQLPLYALAARDALKLGDPTDGFYWHIQKNEPSPFTLRVENAIELAVEHSWNAIRAARAGNFIPQTPTDGCPQWCPAAAFCWHYRPRW